MGDGRRNYGGINYDNPAEGVHQEYVGGAAKTFNSLLGRTIVNPDSIAPPASADTNGNTVTAFTRDNAGSELGYVLLTINGTDDATDAARFNAPDETVYQLRPGNEYEINFNADITRVSHVWVARENNLAQGIILNDEGTGNIQTALCTWVFSGGMRNLKVSISDQFGSPIVGETNRKYASVQIVASE